MSLAANLARSATVAGGLAPTGVVLPFAGAAGQSANGYTMTTLGAGSDQAHNNTQPTLVANYIIKF